MRRSVKSDTVSCHSEDVHLANHCSRSRDPKAYAWKYVEGYKLPTALLEVIIHILLPL